LTYYFSIEKANKEGFEKACKENIEQKFQGHLVDINRFEYDNFMHNRFFNLHIKVNDNTNNYIDYHYNLKPNKEILDFAKTGQIVIKIKGQDTFTLIDTTGVCKTFKIAKCAKYE
jgi:hypothetical protein